MDDSLVCRWPLEAAPLGACDVAIIVPVLNEAAYIEACLISLLAQEGQETVRIVVVDGGSTDQTVPIVRVLQRRYPGVMLLHNPKRLQSAAMNLAAREAPSAVRILVRADAHALYPPDFLHHCLHALRHSGAGSVVVPMRTVGRSGFQRAVAATQNSRLGNGGAAHRRQPSSGFVDHGHHAAFLRTAFLWHGGYDDTFTHNEDAEFDLRARRAGQKIWMCAQAIVTYFPRRSVWALARQYYNHGKGRARTLLKHRERPRLRQIAPMFILLGVVGGISLAWWLPIFALVPLGYATFCLGWGVVCALRQRDQALNAMGLAAMTMHLSWAAGFMGRLAGAAWSGAAWSKDRSGADDGT